MEQKYNTAKMAEIKSHIKELSANNWERRSIVDDSRLSELVEIYESLGFEVHLEPVTPEVMELLNGECNTCYIKNQERFKIIYTRENSLED